MPEVGRRRFGQVWRVAKGRVSAGSVQRWRQTLVCVPVVTTVGWMGQALAIFVLTTIGMGATDPEVRYFAYLFADDVDNWALIYLGNAGAYTGLVLSATTSWGYFRYWWVFIKFVLTIGQLAVGIWVLDPHLAAAAEATRNGQEIETSLLRFGSLLMASVLAFQVWLAIAKPWGRTPWQGATARVPSAPRWGFVLALAVTAGDLALYLLVFGTPVPMLMLLATFAYPLLRKRWWPVTAPTSRRVGAAAAAS